MSFIEYLPFLMKINDLMVNDFQFNYVEYTSRSKKKGKYSFYPFFRKESFVLDANWSMCWVFIHRKL